MADYPKNRAYGAPPLPPLPRHPKPRAQIHTVTGSGSGSGIPSDQQVTTSAARLFERTASDPAVQASRRLGLFDGISDSSYSSREGLFEASYQLAGSRASQIATLGIGSTLAGSQQLHTARGHEPVELSSSDLFSMRDHMHSHTVMGMRGRYTVDQFEQHLLSGHDHLERNRSLPHPHSVSPSLGSTSPLLPSYHSMLAMQRHTGTHAPNAAPAARESHALRSPVLPPPPLSMMHPHGGVTAAGMVTHAHGDALQQQQQQQQEDEEVEEVEQEEEEEEEVGITEHQQQLLQLQQLQQHQLQQLREQQLQQQLQSDAAQQDYLAQLRALVARTDSGGGARRGLFRGALQLGAMAGRQDSSSQQTVGTTSDMGLEASHGWKAQRTFSKRTWDGFMHASSGMQSPDSVTRGKQSGAGNPGPSNLSTRGDKEQAVSANMTTLFASYAATAAASARGSVSDIQQQQLPEAQRSSLPISPSLPPFRSEPQMVHSFLLPAAAAAGASAGAVASSSSEGVSSISAIIQPHSDQPDFHLAPPLPFADAARISPLSPAAAAAALISSSAASASTLASETQPLAGTSTAATAAARDTTSDPGRPLRSLSQLFHDFVNAQSADAAAAVATSMNALYQPMGAPTSHMRPQGDERASLQESVSYGGPLQAEGQQASLQASMAGLAPAAPATEAAAPQQGIDPQAEALPFAADTLDVERDMMARMMLMLPQHSRQGEAELETAPIVPGILDLHNVVLEEEGIMAALERQALAVGINRRQQQEQVECEDGTVEAGGKVVVVDKQGTDDIDRCGTYDVEGRTMEKIEGDARVLQERGILDERGGEGGEEEDMREEGEDGVREEGDLDGMGEEGAGGTRRRGRPQAGQGRRVRPRSTVERERRERISDGLRRLRTVINAQGDTATVLEKAVNDIQMLQRRVVSMETALLLHRSMCPLMARTSHSLPFPPP